MRILYISHCHPPEGQPLKNMGGMQRVNLQLVAELNRRPDVSLHEIVLRTSANGMIPRTVLFLSRMAISLPGIIKEIKPDAVLFSSMVTASLACFIRARIEVPLITVNHGHDVTLDFPPYQAFLPHVFHSLDGVISVSRATRLASIQRGMDAWKGAGLCNGVDVSMVDSLPEREVARTHIQQKLNFNIGDKPLLLTAGRLIKRKGHEWFIRNVLPRIRTDVEYIVIGQGPEYENIVRAVMQTGMEQRIRLPGKQPEETLRAAYAAADLFVMPNIKVPGDMEGFGVVLLEANMAGTPAIASDLEGIKDVIAQGVNGYRVPHGEGRTFARQIDEVLQSDLAPLRKSCREYVKTNFSWERIAERYLAFIEHTIGSYHSEKILGVEARPAFSAEDRLFDAELLPESNM
jgi:phosphatidylinositol alpha-1,6-mannosyltransferase